MGDYCCLRLACLYVRQFGRDLLELILIVGGLLACGAGFWYLPVEHCMHHWMWLLLLLWLWVTICIRRHNSKLSYRQLDRKLSISSGWLRLCRRVLGYERCQLGSFSKKTQGQIIWQRIFPCLDDEEQTTPAKRSIDGVLRPVQVVKRLTEIGNSYLVRINDRAAPPADADMCGLSVIDVYQEDENGHSNAGIVDACKRIFAELPQGAELIIEPELSARLWRQVLQEALWPVRAKLGVIKMRTNEENALTESVLSTNMNNNKRGDLTCKGVLRAFYHECWALVLAVPAFLVSGILDSGGLLERVFFEPDAQILVTIVAFWMTELLMVFIRCAKSQPKLAKNRLDPLHGLRIEIKLICNVFQMGGAIGGLILSASPLRDRQILFHLQSMGELIFVLSVGTILALLIEPAFLLFRFEKAKYEQRLKKHHITQPVEVKNYQQLSDTEIRWGWMLPVFVCMCAIWCFIFQNEKYEVVRDQSVIKQLRAEMRAQKNITGKQYKSTCEVSSRAEALQKCLWNARMDYVNLAGEGEDWIVEVEKSLCKEGSASSDEKGLHCVFFIRNGEEPEKRLKRYEEFRYEAEKMLYLEGQKPDAMRVGRSAVVRVPDKNETEQVLNFAALGEKQCHAVLRVIRVRRDGRGAGKPLNLTSDDAQKLTQDGMIKEARGNFGMLKDLHQPINRPLWITVDLPTLKEEAPDSFLLEVARRLEVKGTELNSDPRQVELPLQLMIEQCDVTGRH